MGLPLEKFPDWPAAMTREVALAFTGVAEKQLAQWEKDGEVTFKPSGPHGSMIAQRDELEAALRRLFGIVSEGRGRPIRL